MIWRAWNRFYNLVDDTYIGGKEDCKEGGDQRFRKVQILLQIGQNIGRYSLTKKCKVLEVGKNN